MTGQIKKEIPIILRNAVFNKDGSKIASLGVISSNTFRVYDTGDWSDQDYDFGKYVFVESVFWTTDDAVVMGGG
jgi:hypothetical protein